jgi:alginate biosynthesis protein Alg44
MAAAGAFRQTMFRRIHNSERKRVLAAIGKHPTVLSAKGNNDEVFGFISDALDDEKLLRCRFEEGSKQPTEDHSVVVNFTFGYERYFFRGFMTTTQDRVFIDASSDFYILQRRKSARLVLPEGYPSGFNMIEYRNKGCFYELRIIDFSSGGIKVWYPLFDPVFVTGEKIKGVVHLGSRRPINLDAVIRHVVTQQDGANAGQVFGLQFDPMNRITEVKMLTIFMDLQREVFIKYSK